jgi:hypothetical protein
MQLKRTYEGVEIAATVVRVSSVSYNPFFYKIIKHYNAKTI